MHSRIKLSARFALNGSQLVIFPLLTLIIFAVFVFSLCNAVFNMFIGEKYFSVIFSILSLAFFVLITAPARYKLEIKHLLLARGCRYLTAKIGFSGIIKSVIFYSAMFCLKAFWFAVFEAIPVSGAIILYLHISEKSLSAKAAITFLIFIGVLFAIGIFFYSVFIQRYSKAAFYLACYKDFSAFDAIRESVRKTRDDLLDILIMKLGFLPWFLLCFAVVPMLFVIPYYKQSIVLYFIKKSRCR